jgi:hypothetical protein
MSSDEEISLSTGQGVGWFWDKIAGEMGVGPGNVHQAAQEHAGGRGSGLILRCIVSPTQSKSTIERRIGRGGLDCRGSGSMMSPFCVDHPIGNERQSKRCHCR